MWIKKLKGSRFQRLFLLPTALPVYYLEGVGVWHLKLSGLGMPTFLDHWPVVHALGLQGVLGWSHLLYWWVEVRLPPRPGLDRLKVG